MRVRSEYFFKRVEKRIGYSEYWIVSPTILTPRNEDRLAYINNMVRHRTRRNASVVFESADGRTVIQVIMDKDGSELTHVRLRNLVKDIWSNNVLRRVLGR